MIYLQVSQKRGSQKFVDEATHKLINCKDSPVAENSSILKELDSKISEEKINCERKEVPEWSFKVTPDVPHPLLANTVSIQYMYMAFLVLFKEYNSI